MTSSDPSPAFDRALDTLYGATPEEFVLVRARLERELRDAGDTAAAAEVRRRRRPNLAAWAGNQLARRRPDDITELLAVTARLAAAQHAVLSGADASDLRELTRERQDLLDHLTSEALTMLRGRAPKPESYRESIHATLDAASIDADASPDLRSGRLARALTAPAGFGPARALTTPPVTSGRARASRREVQAAQRELADAQRRAKEQARAAADAATEQTSAEMQADAAAAHLGEVERALQRGRASADQARRDAEAARRRADAARHEAAQTEERVRRAEDRLADLDAE